MSLLMQALRKAERAKEGRVPAEPHEDGELELAPLETDVQKAAVGNADIAAGGTVFSLEPIAPPKSSEDDIPVVAATEAMHNPVPPQARAAAEGRLAADGLQRVPVHAVEPDPPAGINAVRGAGLDGVSGGGAGGVGARVGGVIGGPARHAAGHVAPELHAADMDAAGMDTVGRQANPQSRSGATVGPRSRTGAALRASANASRQRLGALIGLLTLVLLCFGFLYWRAVSGPGPGAALPPVPMPGPGVAAAPAATGAMIPGVDPYHQQATDPAFALPGPAPGAPTPQVEAAAVPVPAGAGARGAAAAPGPEALTAAHTQPPHVEGSTRAAAPATRPPTRVVMPTAEALAAIQDPAIRAEAMRDAEERAARAARDADVPQPASPPPAPDDAMAAAAPAGASGATVRRTATTPPAPARQATQPLASGPTGAGEVRIVRNNAAPQVSPTLQNAWSAYQAGDLAAARQQYDMALLQDPNSKDALLGSAAVAIRGGNGQQAAGHYVRLLELDPNDAEALAGMAALRPGDIMQTETRLKGILQQSPESGPVLFALGNLYARQARWPEAQQSYFRAYSAAPANPDYAFNLAVGLDRLNQGRLARDYYQRALTLAQAAPAGFSQEAVRKRLQELGAAGP